MTFNNVQTLKHPLATVWSAMRDHLPEIAASQDDIEYVHVEKRAKQAPDAMHVISTWKANPPLPGFLKSFIKPDMLIWTDDAVWNNKKTICHFDIRTRYQVEDIHCVGSIKFEKAGAGKSTKIIYSGILTIERTSKSSIFMTGLVIKGIESVASKLIENNFSKVVKALSENITAEKD